MQINIIDVGTPNTHAAKNGRSYQSLEITYKGNDGKVTSKKLMSFSNPSVFKAASTWNKGDVVDIVTQKDDAGYWQWTGIGTADSAPRASAPSAGSSAPATRVTGSNYETKEERAARQVLIVRQSSLSVAASALAVGAKSSPTAEAIIELAKKLEAYVFAEEVAPEKASPPEITDLEDDIPY